MGDNMQGSLTGNVLSAPTAADPNALSMEDLDKLFGDLENHLQTQGAQNQTTINQMGTGAAAAVNQTTPPAPEAVPQRMSGPARALATFGAGMGASLTRQPAMLTNVQNQINSGDQEASQVEHNNYAMRTAFDQKKQDTLLGQQLRMLELKAEEQIKMGDRDGALQTLKAQTVLAEKLRKRTLEDKTEQQKTLLGMRLSAMLAGITARGEEARKTQDAKDHALTGGMSKDQLEEYKQRAVAIRAAAAAEIQDLQTMQGGPGANSEEGLARAERIKLQLDQDLRAAAAEIRQRNPAPPVTPPAHTPNTPPAATPAAGAPKVEVDAKGVPTDPIRRALYLRQHPTR